MVTFHNCLTNRMASETYSNSPPQIDEKKEKSDVSSFGIILLDVLEEMRANARQFGAEEDTFWILNCKSVA